MEHGMTRREMIQASALLLGGACSCRMASDSTALRSTCCNTPDLEPDSLTINEDNLTIDLKTAHSLGEVGNAAWITNEDKGLKLIIVRAGASTKFSWGDLFDDRRVWHPGNTDGTGTRRTRRMTTEAFNASGGQARDLFGAAIMTELTQLTQLTIASTASIRSHRFCRVESCIGSRVSWISA